MKYGIIQLRNIYHEGDERSRTNPGHGYPAHTETVTSFKEFEDREKWEKEINDLANPKYGSPKKFRAITFEEVEITKEVKINIS